METLKNKVVMISGTAGGQGRAAALAFSRVGAKIFGCDVNAVEDAETVRLVRQEGGTMESLAPLDPSDPGQAERWAKAANDTFGGIDILYNNGASLRAFGPFADSTMEDWEGTVRYELTIVYTSTKAVWPYLIERGGGAIISTASVCAHVELQPFRSAAHGACKAGVIALARMFAAEGRDHGIRSNSISPGLITVPLNRIYQEEYKELGDALISKIPAGRMGNPEEVANLAVFLASPAASYINAADIIVDGGLYGINNMVEPISIDYKSAPIPSDKDASAGERV